MKLADWIKTARTHAELTQTELGDKLGRTKANISAWEKGSHEPSYQQVIDIASITNIDIPPPGSSNIINQSISADTARHTRANKLSPRPNHVILSVLDVSPSAGSGSTPVDYPAVIDYLEVPEAWAKYKLGKDLSKYRLLPVSGDSMSPTINDGDLAFVDTNVRSFDAEGIYVIIWNDRLLIKRLRVALATQRVEIRSDNSEKYEPETVSIDEAARLHICGFVRCWWSIKTA